MSVLQARENEGEEEDEGATVDSAVCSGSLAESASLNIEPCLEATATVSTLNAPQSSLSHLNTGCSCKRNIFGFAIRRILLQIVKEIIKR